MQTVYLKGELGERFGEKWSMNVDKVQDIFKLIECQRDGYRQYMVDCAENGIDFTVQRGEEFIDETEFLLSVGKEDIIVAPVPAGSKGNVGKLIAAAFMIYTGYWLVQGAAAGAAGTTAQLGYAADAGVKGMKIAKLGASMGKWGKVLGYGAMALGTSLGLTTLAQMTMPDGSQDEEDDSHLFSGPQNTTVQGGAVPILYGEMIVGGTLINSSYTASMAPQGFFPGIGWNQPLGIDSGDRDVQVEEK